MDLTPIPFGTDTQVNTTTDGSQISTAVTALSDGGFVVVWVKYIGGQSYGTYGQRYAADGTPVGSEFLAGSGAYDTGFFPTVTGLADGGFVVI